MILLQALDSEIGIVITTNVQTYTKTRLTALRKQLNLTSALSIHARPSGEIWIINRAKETRVPDSQEDA